MAAAQPEARGAWRRSRTRRCTWSRSRSAAVVIVPIAYVVLGGFRTTGQLAFDPVGLPHPWVTHNYTKVITSGAFWRQVGNSTIIAAIATVLVVGVSALAAYPLSRFQFRGREAIYTFFTFGLLFPIAVAALPLYLLLRQLAPRRHAARRRAAGGGVRDPDHDHHPAPVHAERPGRARGRGGDRRLHEVRVLPGGSCSRSPAPR